MSVKQQPHFKYFALNVFLIYLLHSLIAGMNREHRCWPENGLWSGLNNDFIDVR